jgi:hypothetical protein
VWGYALLWFLLNDRVKLLAYRIFDPVKAAAKPEATAAPKTQSKSESEHKAEAVANPAVEPNTEAKVEPKPEAKAEPIPETKAAEPQPEAKPESKPKAKTTSDLTKQIATRAYELYEQQGHRDGQSVQNWDKAEREIQKNQAVNPETQAEPKPEVKAEAKPENKVEAKPESKVEPQPEAKTEAETPSDLTPQIVKRVHELYEELGRKDIQAVEDLEKAESETRKDQKGHKDVA